MAPERTAEHVLRRARGREQRREIHAGLDPHLVQHRDEILGGDVAGRPGRHRAAAELAELDSKLVTPASSAASTFAKPWPRVLWKWAVSSIPGRRSNARAKNSLTWTGFAIPVVSPNATSAAGVGQRQGDREHALERYLTLVRAPERGRDHALAAQPLRARPGERPPQPVDRIHTARLTFFRLWLSEADKKPLISWKRSRSTSARSSPRWFGISTLTDTDLGSETAPSTCSASASWGITSGRTKLVTSIRRRPVAPRGRSAAPFRRSGSPRARSGTVPRPDLADPHPARKLAHELDSRSAALSGRSVAARVAADSRTDSPRS